MKWTHKVVYEDTGQWWMSGLVDGTLYHISDMKEKKNKTTN